jgi:hypothetical protein
MAETLPRPLYGASEARAAHPRPSSATAGRDLPVVHPAVGGFDDLA